MATNAAIGTSDENCVIRIWFMNRELWRAIEEGKKAHSENQSIGFSVINREYQKYYFEIGEPVALKNIAVKTEARQIDSMIAGIAQLNLN